jgi:hypothetical protein
MNTLLIYGLIALAIYMPQYAPLNAALILVIWWEGRNAPRAPSSRDLRAQRAQEDREQARLERQWAERSARRAARIAELGLPPEPPIGPVILDGSGANPYQAWSEWFTKVLRAGYDVETLKPRERDSNFPDDFGREEEQP